MHKAKLTPTAKQLIADNYSRGLMNQGELATLYNCSRRTINRALQEKGIIEPRPVVTPQDLKILNIVHAHGLGATELRRVLRLGGSVSRASQAAAT